MILHDYWHKLTHITKMNTMITMRGVKVKNDMIDMVSVKLFSKTKEDARK